jgi:hypothetical protein
LKRAVTKYGVGSFDLTILDLGYSQIDLDKKEVHWIRELNTIVPTGYNLSGGGGGGGNQHPLVRERKSRGRKEFLSSRAARGLPKGPTTLTEADVREIFRRFDEGEKQKSIAQFFKVDRSTVSHIIEGKNWAHLGLKSTRLRRKSVDLNQAREIFRLNSKLVTSNVIGIKLGISKPTVNRVLREGKYPELVKEFGTRKRFPQSPSSEVTLKDRELRCKGLTYRKIGIELGVHEVTAWTYCNR